MAMYLLLVKVGCMTHGRKQLPFLPYYRNRLYKGGFEKDDDGELYLIIGNKIVQFREGTTPKTLKFRSKVFATPYPTSFSWISVDAEAYLSVLK